MNAISFYGAARPRARIRFLASAKDIVESQESDDLEIVLLPPESADEGIDSDEEGNNNILNEECLPYEIAGEVEVGYMEGILKTKRLIQTPGVFFGAKVTM